MISYPHSGAGRYPNCHFHGHETDDKGYGGYIRFATDGAMQNAERDLNVAHVTRHINPVERGHIAFRTDDIQAFMADLDANGSSMPITAQPLLKNGTRYSFMILKEILLKCSTGYKKKG